MLHVHRCNLFIHKNLLWKYCNMLTFDPVVNQGIGASGRIYQGITLIVGGLNWVLMRRLQEAAVRQTII